MPNFRRKAPAVTAALAQPRSPIRLLNFGQIAPMSFQEGSRGPLAFNPHFRLIRSDPPSPPAARPRSTSSGPAPAPRAVPARPPPSPPGAAPGRGFTSGSAGVAAALAAAQRGGEVEPAAIEDGHRGGAGG